jgi:hypothetical protein
MWHYGILASKNKATELNTAKSEFGLAAWTKTEVDWKTIAREKLNLNPDLCTKCKVGLLEISEGIPPERGPPIFHLKPELNYRHNKERVQEIYCLSSSIFAENGLQGRIYAANR